MSLRRTIAALALMLALASCRTACEVRAATGDALVSATRERGVAIRAAALVTRAVMLWGCAPRSVDEAAP